MVLAAGGSFGVVSSSVSRRTREIGIRMALGAQRHAIVTLVTGRAFALTVAGIGVGVLSAVLLGRGLRSLLFEVAPTDPWVLASGGATIAAVALLASFLPARRATRVDPLSALRED